MSDMKCPFCQQELVAWMGRDDLDFRVCDNPTCNAGIRGHIATIDLWQELIRTRKALGIAVDGLKDLKEKAYLTEYAQSVIDKAMKQITATLEQKD